LLPTAETPWLACAPAESLLRTLPTAAWKTGARFGKARRLEGGAVRFQLGLRFLNLGRVGGAHDVEHQIAGGRNCHVLKPFRCFLRAGPVLMAVRRPLTVQDIEIARAALAAASTNLFIVLM
jgi:hypothetical protein